MRTLDAKFLTALANEPEIRPFLGRKGELDLAPIIGDPNNFAFVCEQGGFVGIRLQPGIYELHTIFRPGDGVHVMAFAAKCMRWMFIHTDCVELKTKVPASNGGARVLAVRAGMCRIFDRPTAWEAPDGGFEGVEYFSITIDKWAVFDKENAAYGAQFRKVETADTAHDAFLGAALQMMIANNPGKGVQFYNRWAAFTECDPINILGANPPLFEVFGEVMQISGQTIEVLKCQ